MYSEDYDVDTFPIFETFDGDSIEFCMEDIEEKLWTLSYETFMNKQSVRGSIKFVPVTSADVAAFSEEYFKILRLVEDRLEKYTLEYSILSAELHSVRTNLLALCPHLLFEAEYLEEKSTYLCTLCKLPYMTCKDARYL
jgi:hypothetical protein